MQPMDARVFLLLASRDGLLAPIDPSAIGAPATAHVTQSPWRLVLNSAGPGTDFFDGFAAFGQKGARLRAPENANFSGLGNYMLARESNGEVTIGADPLGSYPVFIYDDGRLSGVSNNLYLLAAALRANGVSIKKSMGMFAFLVTTGCGSLDLTGYRKISLVPVGAKVVISKSNKVRVERANLGSLFYSDRPYSELLDDAAHDLVNNVKAAASADEWQHKICDLSGGRDSRLVTAAVVAAGLKDDFLFRSGGTNKSPDGNVAALVRRRVGLRWINNIYTGNPDSSRRLSRWDRFVRTMEESFWMVSMQYGIGIESGNAGGILHLAGGYGECFRGSYGVKFEDSDTPLAAYASVLRGRGAELSDHVSSKMASRIEQYGRRLAADGLKTEHVVDFYYMANRARHHFGALWRASLNYRGTFHPLYSINAIRAGFSLPFGEMTSNRLGRDLIKRLCPEMDGIPFTTPGMTLPDIRVGDDGEKPLTVPGLAAPRSFEVEVDGKPHQWSGVEQMKKRFWQTANDKTLARMAPTFDPKKVRRMLTRKEYQNKYQVWRVYRLMMAHEWANHKQY